MTYTQTDTTYNGWANYETWNVALWLGNDEGLYNLCEEYDNYKELADCLKEMGSYETPDGVAWTDSALDYERLTEVINED